MTQIKRDWTKPVQYSRKNGEWEDVSVVYQDAKGVYVEFTTGIRAHYSLGKDFHSGWWRNKKESRAVPKDNRLDLTKPLEVYNIYQDVADDVTFVGALREDSRNFMSWFVMHGRYCSNYEGYFLMRGDGKTDIPGLTVRNKEVKPKLKLPLEVGKKYRLVKGQLDIEIPEDGVGLLQTDYWSDRNIGVLCGMHVNLKTGKHAYGFGYDVVEGPLA